MKTRTVSTVRVTEQEFRYALGRINRGRRVRVSPIDRTRS